MFGALGIAAASAALIARSAGDPFNIRPAAKKDGSKSWYQQPKRKVQHLAEPQFAAMVNRMTNWDRKRWARAGYPGLKEKSPDKVREFLVAHHRRSGEARVA